MLKLFISSFSLGIGGILIGAIMPKYYPLIEPYAGYILCIGVLFVVFGLCLAGFECFKWYQNKKRIKEQIKPILPPPTSKPSEPLSKADVAKEKTSKRERLNNLIKETEVKISVAHAKGQYLSALPGFGDSVAELLKKKEQYLKELEKLK